MRSHWGPWGQRGFAINKNHIKRTTSSKIFHEDSLKWLPWISFPTLHEIDVQLDLRTHLHNHRNSRVWSLICTALFHLKKQDKHLNCIWGSTQAILIFIFRVSALTSSHRQNCLHKLKYLVYTFSYRSFIFLSEMFIRERLF